MSVFTEHREVRVTARESIKTPFVAPELSPVRTVDAELEKGTKGWTDFSNKPEVVNVPTSEIAAEREAALVEDITITGDTVIRKAPRKNAPKVRHPRPTKRRWA
ncbi:hypothetical protein SEA_POMAR16_98 [Mycobacterium phage Pomar16]|uniref:Uncharacterized protein n=2 Tax=root TaxID=1 RepID=A0A2Z5XD47_BPMD2|nr:hypothetical protein SEA_POMAR16_98 [Mycobacterium phage Pomar16]APC46213.1 hypothetical protein PBI_STARSTUFF_98 [Mycobacterium phage StarStuff]AXH48959.1 hypothetical protein SEA_TOMATHAN_98 [Mycobacterium phage Tomathan]QBP28756.1 hypothetical protein SEA_DBQU4N_98 [Mycobacterium phage DBQu4n]UXE05512.1 hypothetical protein SEA_DUPLO_99 [Mycobacterium phage Duplo]BBC44208.1 hypothetical protein [Fromanvirus D29]